MVSFYNTLPYSQKHSANLAYSAGQPWQWTANYHHTPPNHQYLGDMDSTHAAAAHHQMYYNPHAMYHHSTNAAAAAASEWHSPSSAAENFSQNSQLLAQQHQQLLQGTVGGGTTPSSSSVSASSTTSAGPASGSTTQLNETVSSIGDPQQAQQQQQSGQQQQQAQHHIAEGLPSPPITVSGSEISSPGAPASSSSPHHIAHHLNNNNSPSTANNNNNNNNTINHNNNNRSSPIKSHQYYDWMKKPTYPAQPAPGKTRTKDKYRVVYTDFQRLELEKEYCTSRYITIRRKTELAQTLSLSERQVKIWFQNRRAKERKQNKKVSEPSIGGVQHPDYANLMDTKPKLEPGLHLQHSLHTMNSMAAMGMPTMRLPPHLHSHHLAMSAAHSHQLHQPSHAQISAAVGSLSM
ncbi:homeotic protein caudal-like [Musca autumnalis]|uniref:homeotic protein caudal-like n=1 Tax=Musca autumnalis TaxID=221902 RepID=UPI003CF45424